MKRSLFVLVILILNLATPTWEIVSAQPQINKGELDLRNWDFQNQPALKLEGEWAFYWNKLLVQDELFNQHIKPDDHIFVPKIWNDKVLTDGTKVTGDGFATYHLDIRLPNRPTKLGMFLLYAASAYRITLIDSQQKIIPIMESGIIGKSVSDYTPSMAPRMVTFVANGDIRLFIEVTNFHWARGGLWQTPILGSDLRVLQKRSQEKIQNYLIFGCVLAIAFYCFAQFFSNRKEVFPLYYGIICAMVVLMLSIRRGYLIDLFPVLMENIAFYSLYIKAWYLNLAAVAVSFLGFYSNLFNEIFRKNRFYQRLTVIKNLIYGGLAIYALTITFTSSKTNTAITIYFYVLVFLIFLWVFYALFWIAIKQRNSAAWMSLLSLLVFFAATINDILFSRKIILTTNTQQFGYLFFVLQAYVLLREINRARYKAEAQAKTLLRHSPDIILDIDRNSRLKYLNRYLDAPTHLPFAQDLDDYVGESIYEILPPDSHQVVKNRVEQLFTEGYGDMVEIEVASKENSQWLEFRFAAVKVKSRVKEAMIIITDISKRKEMAQELARAQKELIDKAHKAGMAEIATETLHNTGNVLNSIKTSTHVIKQTVDNSPLLLFQKTCDLIRDNQKNLEQFMLESPLGRKTFDYLLHLEGKFEDSYRAIRENADRQNKKIGLISAVIFDQQKYAGTASFAEEVNLVEIIEDALAMTVELSDTEDIIVQKKLHDTPEIVAPKAKLLHTLINLFKNASFALKHADVPEKNLLISLEAKDNQIVLTISDNGVGIEKENLSKIFNHGFTTHKGGSGFGLHSCANYAQEMGAKIEAFSEGLGKGATFRLTFNS